MRQPLYIVLHSPKTAGQTLNRNFRNNYKADEILQMYTKQMGLDDVPGAVVAPKGKWVSWWNKEIIDKFVELHLTKRVKCLFGHHIYFGIHRLVSPNRDCKYITFLRDPVERVISTYFYRKNNRNNFYYHQINEKQWSLEEWFEQSGTVDLYNGQLRYLIQDAYDEVFEAEDLTRVHLAEGLNRLRQFDYVGLTETFADDSRFIYGKLGFWRVENNIKVNAAPRADGISDRTRTLIAERNQLDLELYEFARQLRLEYIKQHPTQFQVNTFKAEVIGRLQPVWQSWDRLKDWLWNHLGGFRESKTIV